MKPQDIREAFVGRIWYVHEQKMNELLAFLGAVGPEKLEAIRAQQPQMARPASIPSTGKSGGSIAVIPIQGMISHRSSIFSYFFGGASTEDLVQQIRQAVADPSVSAIVLDVDSPGGDVDGVDELASEIYQARKAKPITAVSNCLCASAAYYLASQASEIIASPSSLTGSVGVYTTHADLSGALDNAGVKMTMIKYGDNKGEGNPYEALSDPAREHLQELVDSYGGDFEKAVARGRGLKQDDVHSKFGQGRMFGAKQAVKLGMVDRVGTLDDALVKHGAARGSSMRHLSVVDPSAVAATIPVPSAAAAAKTTKRVDGEDLEKEAFAYRPTDKLDDWKLPIEFSTDEKSASHIRNAISRWASTDMPDAGEKSKARGRIKAAAKKHDIEVDDKSLAADRKLVKTDGRWNGPCRGKCETELWGTTSPYCNECTAAGKDPFTPVVAGSKKADVDPDGECGCDCGPCDDGDCEGCDCEGCTCEGCACEMAMKARKTKAEHARMRHQLAVAGA